MYMANWIPDTNRFALKMPPQWWLSKLWDFDSSLVVVPSRQSCIYRLAQRRKLNLPEKVVNEALFNESDTQMLASYSLVPVTSIIANPNWSHAMFQELAARAPWRQGGADEVVKKMELQEAEDAYRKQMETDDMLTQLSKDAWGLYGKKIGVRTSMYSPRTKESIVGGNKAPAIKIK